MSRSPSALVLALALAFSFASLTRVRASAQSPEEAARPAWTLDHVLALLDERSDALRAERLTVDVARADEHTARIVPNPVVSAQLLQTVRGDVDSFNGTQPQITLEQPIPIAGQRRARMTYAKRRTAAIRAEVALFHEQAAAEARRAFVRLLARQRAVEVLEAAAGELEQAATIVRGRAASGDRSRYDALRIEVEVRRVAVELEAARAEVEAASRGLAALVGVAGARPRALGDLTPEDDEATPSDVLDEDHPAMEVARRSVSAAEAASSVARREAVPMPVIGGGAAFTTRSYASAAYVGLTIPLPLFDRNQGRVEAARAEVRVAEARRQSTLVALESELQRAIAVLDMRRQALERFEGGVYASLPELGAMAEAAYRSGTTSILEVVDSLRTRRELEREHLDYLEAVKLAEIDVLAASGRARGQGRAQLGERQRVEE
jgi:cobalt-zinc-cadmium efflux system outer membrane protein